MVPQPLALLLSMTHWSPEPKEHLLHCFPLVSSHGGPTMHTHSYSVKVIHRVPCDGHIKWAEGTHTQCFLVSLLKDRAGNTGGLLWFQLPSQTEPSPPRMYSSSLSLTHTWEVAQLGAHFSLKRTSQPIADGAQGHVAWCPSGRA